MDTKVLERHTRARRAFLHTQAEIKRLEAKLTSLKNELPHLRTEHTRGRKIAFAACGYNLTGSDKADIYSCRSKKSTAKKAINLPPLCLDKYFTPMVESFDAEDIPKNDGFIKYFIETWIECDCAVLSSSERNGLHSHGCFREKVREFVFTDLYKAEQCQYIQAGEETFGDIHVAVAKRHESFYFWFIFPKSYRLQLRTRFYHLDMKSNVLAGTQCGFSNKFVPWHIPVLWNYLLDIHRKTIAAKRIQRSWRKRT